MSEKNRNRNTYEEIFGRSKCADCGDNKNHMGKLRHINGEYLCESCAGAGKYKHCEGQHCLNTEISKDDDYCSVCKFMASLSSNAES